MVPPRSAIGDCRFTRDPTRSRLALNAAALKLDVQQNEAALLTMPGSPCTASGDPAAQASL
jgi:hypothetical protein